MSYEKTAKLVEKIGENTSAGKIKWEKTSRGDIFLTSFPDYSVSIEILTSASFMLRVFDSEGTLIEEVSNHNIMEFLPNATDIMKNIYKIARRSALGVDVALDAILKELDGNS